MIKYQDQLIELAINEDIGDGDHTSLSCIPESAIGKARLIVKEDGIIAGIDIAARIFKKIDENLQLDVILKDGDKITKGDIAFTVEGKKHSILQAERIVLNFMQRMSGIATRTSEYVELLKGLKTKVLDTRKTTPGLRFIEKEAVRIGGGKNHRMGLYDMIMIKDNHIDFAGGIVPAISKSKEYIKSKNKNLKIEIEVRTIDDIKTILQAGGIDRIMLDNFSIEKTKEAVELIAGKYEIESSGGITYETIRDYAACGVDYISVGALTHQIKSLDMSLKAVF
ncbi:MAG: carboxylating nicotinate-nucleotide diphosphorylase [Bacteroidetes bacterium]|jgi:nicotinate-nucleotide pyrophosphorylase (carboxylating)|nr:carboxylating nicotinate-nucleotide diphosphorylase [Bacteroidota bacterium]MBT6684805.1 carboxylating nicotinate-nucleotide diphosphorylase [Bacteroidota bacterium]MBT7141781.1 carboxylating nicotinate-nucleotide diphosphorylase [Bacteroidota bacterium]MBT7490749.1 carboxylating nicotinate-nucleotide diphosphorylase [Bacteroidota bacterium]